MQITAREKVFLIVGGAIIVFIALFFTFRTITKNLMSVSSEKEDLLSERSKIISIGQQYLMWKAIDIPKTSRVSLDEVIDAKLKSNPILTDKYKLSPTDSIQEKKYKKRTVTINISRAPAQPVLEFISQIENENKPFKVESFFARETGKTKGIYSFKINIVSLKKI